MTGPARYQRLELLRKIWNGLHRTTVRKTYTDSMPCRAYVHLKDVSKPSVIPDGANIDIDKEAGELTVKDVLGEVRGRFNLAAVVGWWLERDPLDLSKMSKENLVLVMAELAKCGMIDPADLS